MRGMSEGTYGVPMYLLTSTYLEFFQEERKHSKIIFPQLFLLLPTLSFREKKAKTADQRQEHHV